MCTVIAILLHFFYMCVFAWMFVEGLHIYRMLTEQRNINHGHMRFYYAIGWGFPAIITGEDSLSRTRTQSLTHRQMRAQTHRCSLTHIHSPFNTQAYPHMHITYTCRQRGTTKFTHVGEFHQDYFVSASLSLEKA